MSALARVLETEVMDTASEAADYDAMDHVAVNSAFCTDFLATGPSVASVLDVGTGTARIPIELARRDASAKIVGSDLADHMLRVAKANVDAAGLADRIRLDRQDAKAMTYDTGTFSAVVCNTILHHIPEPQPALAEMQRVLARGGCLFLRDLIRPADETELAALVALHGGEPTGTTPQIIASHERQMELFRASLNAAFTLDEMRAAAIALGMPASSVARTSDRHWTLAWKKPA